MRPPPPDCGPPRIDTSGRSLSRARCDPKWCRTWCWGAKALDRQNYNGLRDGVDWPQAVFAMQEPGVRQLTSRIRIAELGFRAGSAPRAKLTGGARAPHVTVPFSRGRALTEGGTFEYRSAH